MRDKKKYMIIALCVVGLLTAMMFLKERLAVKEPVRVLERNSPGQGNSKVALEAQMENGKFLIDFELGERKYADDELDEIFSRGKEWLDQVWLGDNEKAEEVSENLYFPSQIPELGLAVRWETESYRWIQSDGKITENAFENAPLETTVRATLCYGQAERQYSYNLTIEKELLSGSEALQENILDTIRAKDIQENTSSEFVLPETIDGLDIVWYEKESLNWPKVFIFGILIIVLLYFRQEEKVTQELKTREKELSQDYPEIVYHLVLLIGAGMTVKGAWKKMTEDYQNDKNITGCRRWGYEEMETALREMNYGIAELKAYENFGKRCGNQNYIRLSSLLIQQVRRGAQGMNQLLMQEIVESEIIRKENVRKMAEEAGTKLLLPMIIMMTIVFAILMIPAFLSMNI